jgi:diaminopimelate epimerase
MRPIMIVKAHAFGNDFVLVESRAVQGAKNLSALAQAICARHRGIGADGLIVYSTTPSGASMRLLNADGSRSEVSGNGVRCLGAWIASQRGTAMPGSRRQ